MVVVGGGGGFKNKPHHFTFRIVVCESVQQELQFLNGVIYSYFLFVSFFLCLVFLLLLVFVAVVIACLFVLL